MGEWFTVDGKTEAGPFSGLPEAPARRAWGPGALASPLSLCLRLPQLHHACTGPGLSVLCFLRHDVLEYFSVYGTALSMWVSLMGEWPPPPRSPRPCTCGQDAPLPAAHPGRPADGPALRPPVRRHVQGTNASTPFFCNLLKLCVQKRPLTLPRSLPRSAGRLR